MKNMNIIIGTFVLFFTGTLTCLAQHDYFSSVENTGNHTALELAEMDGRFSNFVEFVELSGLDISLEFAEDFTIFMPTNEAFGELEVEKLANLSDPNNKVELMKFVRNYILPTKVSKYEFGESKVIDTSGDEEITISTEGELVYIGGAQIIAADIEAEDAIIHIVDNLIQPTGDIITD